MRYTYNHYFDRAIPGQREGSINFQRVRSYQNRINGQREIWLLTTPATPADDTEYTVTINNHGKAKFTTGTGTTQEEFAEGLVNAIRTNPAFGLYVTATVDPTFDILLTSSKLGETSFITVTGASLSAAIAQNVSTPPIVPFGRFVGRPAGTTDPHVAGLIQNTTDKVLGITSLIRDVERFDIRSGNQRPGYIFNEVMDVVDYCGASMGIWVECVESDITIADNVYVSVAAGNEGKVSKTLAGNIDLSAKATFESDVKTTVEGVQVVLVHFDI